MLLSVIIPVYNSQKYIKECISSITNQSYKNIEIIVVDDGSSDDSVNICKELMKKDNRIKVFTKKNGGTSSARNFGLKKATGDYITFIDNDDYWDKENAIEEIMDQLNETKADILLFNSKDNFVNTKGIVNPSNIIDRQMIYDRDKNKFLKNVLKNGLYYRAVWTKIIKSSLIKNNGLTFEEGMRNEDTDFSAKLMLLANSYDYYKDVFHVYRKGHETAQTSKPVSYKSLNDLTVILEKYFKEAEKINDLEFKKCFLSYLAFPFSVWMGQVGYFDNKKEEIKKMKKYKYVLNYTYDKRVKLASFVCKIVGFKNTCYILNIYMKLKYRRGKR